MKSYKSQVLFVLSVVLILVLTILAFLVFSPQNPSENALPTLVVLNTLSPTIETESTISPEEDTLLDATETVLASDLTVIPSETEAPLEASATNTEVPLMQVSATNTQTVIMQASATSQSNNPAPTATGGGSIVIAPQASPTTASSAPLVPSNTPQGFVPTATFDQTGLVPFNQPMNIGGGVLRVLSMTAPADEVMLSLGTGIPSVQANQQWVLIELFLICEGTSICTPPNTSFTLDSNITSYSTTPLNIESTFGDLILDGQILGHIAFVIPRTEAPFALELNRNGVEYRFALQ